MLTQPGTVIRHNTIVGALLFETEGYLPISSKMYGDSKISFLFNLPLNSITLIPKYLSDDNFLFLTIYPDGRIHIGAFIKGAERTYASLFANLLSSSNQLTLTSNGSQFIVDVNGVDLYHFVSAIFVNGQVRIHGEQNEVFYSCTIKEPQSVDWETNGDIEGAEIKCIEIENRNFMNLTGSGSIKAEIHQSLSLDSGNYSLSFSHEGSGRAYIKDSSNNILAEQSYTSLELDRNVLSFVLIAPATIDCYFETDSEWSIGEVQVELGEESPYIPNDNDVSPSIRENSQLSYPLKETMPLESGSLYLKISVPNNFNENSINNQLLFRTNDNQLRLDYQPNAIVFTHKEQTLSNPITLSTALSADILISWHNNQMECTVNGITVEREDTTPLSATINQFIFAESGSIEEPMILEEWALFASQLDPTQDIQTSLPFAIMQSLFTGGISGQNVTWSEIPIAPFDHSPILVQKANGETLRKVSFFDMESGRYRTWNEEPVLYDGKSNYIEVAYSNLNKDFQDLAIKTEDGEIIGQPYRIDGKRFYFDLAEEIKRSLKDKILYAVYQVNDTYTIDYNIKAPDGYRVDFARHEGGSRFVYQEGNRYGEPVKLATMIDLNPIQNQNHEGFLYVTNTINQTESFRITATPDRLRADGSSFATLVIEPLDYQGNFLSHAHLEIIADKGFIARHISKDAVEAQKRSGQYLYQYYAPYIQSQVDGEIAEDYIWIIDQNSKIGIGYKMILRPILNSSATELSRLEKNYLTDKTTFIQYLLAYEGLESYEDSLLLSILDLNQDGQITTDEITLLETNQISAVDLAAIIERLKDWEV